MNTRQGRFSADEGEVDECHQGPPATWDREVNILIAGAGVAGCSAAIAAAEAGDDSVLVLEKMPHTGGSGTYSSGTIIAAGTVMQREHGIDDSPDAWYRDALETCVNGVDVRLIRALVDSSQETFESLRRAGMRWSFVDALPGYSAARSYREANGGVKLMGVMAAEMKKRPGIEIALQTRITRLITDCCGGSYPQGEVIGVQCEDGTGRISNIRVRKAVGLCTGDFAAHPAYIENHFPALKGTKFTGNPGNTGDGIRIAQRLGADITGYVPQGHPHCVETESGKAILWCRYEFLAEDGLILVNAAGERFCNEPEKGYYVPLFSEAQRQNGKFACVFDAAGAAAIQRSPRVDTTFRGNAALFRDGLTGGNFVVKQADTLEALATQIGVDAAGLVKTVAAYNAAAAAGADTAFQRKPQFLRPIGTPPYYGWKGVVGVTTTRGGLRIAPDTRVLDPDLKPIPRLYAAGATVGGYINEVGYRSGWHLSNALAFGRIAGRMMAGERVWG